MLSNLEMDTRRQTSVKFKLSIQRMISYKLYGIFAIFKQIIYHVQYVNHHKSEKWNASLIITPMPVTLRRHHNIQCTGQFKCPRLRCQTSSSFQLSYLKYLFRFIQHSSHERSVGLTGQLVSALSSSFCIAVYKLNCNNYCTLL